MLGEVVVNLPNQIVALVESEITTDIKVIYYNDSERFYKKFKFGAFESDFQTYRL